MSQKNKIIVSDMHGPHYIYVPEKGISITGEITPSEATESEHGPFAKAIETTIGKAYDDASTDEILNYELNLVKAIISGEGAPCGIKINFNGARYLIEAIEGKEYAPLIISSSRELQSALILEKAFELYRNETGRKEINPVSLASSIPKIDMSFYGSKSDPQAWEKAFHNFIKGTQASIDIIIEDHTKKRDAALVGATRLGFSPLVYDQITEDMHP